MKQCLFCVQVTFLLLFFAMGCDAFNALSSSNSKTAMDSGLRGKLLMGPTCPAPSSEKDCSPVPVSATIEVLNPGGEVVKTFQSDEEGNFEVMLAPGTYRLRPARDPEESVGKIMAVEPRGLRPSQVEVQANEIKEITLVLDSGIR